MKAWKLVCLFLLMAFSSSAMDSEADDESNASLFRPLSVGLDAGTTGLGAGGSWRFSDHYGVRGGFDYFSYSRNSTIEGVPYDATVRPMSELFGLNIHPWKNSSFRVTVGALFNQNRLTGTATDANGITLDGTFYPAGQVGTLNLKIEQQLLNPYLSVGGTLFYFDRAHHWSFGGELGVFYTGDPKVSLTRSGGVADSTIDAAVAQEKQSVENYAKRYQFWPVLKLVVNCSF